MRFYITVFLLVCGVSWTHAQTVQLGGGGGIAIPTADYGGSTVDFYNGTKYGLSTGSQFHGKFRAGWGDITIITQLDRMVVKNSGNSEPGKGRIEHSHRVTSFRVGPEFSLDLGALPFTPAC